MSDEVRVSPAIAALNQAGQSVWCDNLSKSMLISGELARLIEQGVSGLTSNPTIFKKSIADSNAYDDEIARLSEQGLSVDEICESLFIEDVGGAADLLLPNYKSTKGEDGYASIEVAPSLAHDTQGTIEAGVRLWEKLRRPNVMIKVPATEEGIPAIEELLARGINVNITLIFSNETYNKVIEAYLRGLERREKGNQPVNQIASVASFFVSRVDSIVEKGLAKGGGKHADAFIGKVGIANSKLAYRLFKQKFSTDRFAALARKGARLQRPLWASTGTKNPKFSPVLYVEALVAKDTVNTLPPATLDAVLRGLTVKNTIEQVSEAEATIEGLDTHGIRFDSLLQQLQKEGVELFADSYRELVESIEAKKKLLSQ